MPKCRLALAAVAVAWGCHDAPTEPRLNHNLAAHTTSAVAESDPVVVLDVIDLGVLPGGRTSEARRVNDAGVMVGTSERVVDPEGFFSVSRAFVWQNGVMSDASADGVLHNRESFGYGINSAGVVVGQKFVHDGSEPFAIAWQANQEVFSMPATLRESDARDINDAGVIVGSAFSTASTRRATRWHNGTQVNLGVLPNGLDSRAFAVNNAGHVVGISVAVIGQRLVEQAFLWRDGSMIQLPPLEPNAPTFAFDISETGLVVGMSIGGSNDTRGVLWRGGVPHELPPLPGHVRSRALGVNDAGHAVGYSQPSSGSTRAVLWYEGVPIDLGALSGLSSSGASGINNRGHVVGWSGGPAAPNRATMWVINAAPKINTGGPYEGKKKKPIILNATRTFDAEHDALSFRWDFGDGSAPAVGAIVEHEYADHGTYTVTLTVTDGRGLSATSTTTAQIGPIKKGSWRSPHVPD